MFVVRPAINFITAPALLINLRLSVKRKYGDTWASAASTGSKQSKIQYWTASRLYWFGSTRISDFSAEWMGEQFRKHSHAKGFTSQGFDRSSEGSELDRNCSRSQNVGALEGEWWRSRLCSSKGTIRTFANFVARKSRFTMEGSRWNRESNLKQQRRNKRQDSCLEDWKYYDWHFMEYKMDEVGCRPPHWKIKSYLPICTDAIQMKSFESQINRKNVDANQSEMP